MNGIEAGRLRTFVAIQQATETRTPGGAVTTTWATLASVWAGIYPRSGRERFLAGKTVAEGDTSIYIRYRSDVTPRMRVLAGGVIYNIGAVLDTENRHIQLELICTTGLNNG